MSLRARLFLLFGGLMVLLVVGQGLMVRALTRDLTDEVGEMAVQVGRDVISGVHVMSGEHVTLGKHLLDDVEPGGTRVVRRSVRTLPAGEERLIREALPVEGEGAAPEMKLEEAEGGTRVAVWHFPDGAEGTDEIRMQIPPGADLEGTLTYELFISDGDRRHSRAMILSGPSARQVIPIPQAGVSSAVDRTSNRLLLGTVGMLALGLVLAGVVAHRVSAPLRGLADAARQVGTGSLGLQAPPGGGGEVGAAIASFNQMSSRLRQLDSATRTLRAREHLGELGEVARGLAHTLRNPLNALGLSLEELAARAPESRDTDDLVSAARRQIKRIDGSIRSFLALAAEGGGQVEAQDMGSLVKDVALEAMQDSAEQVIVEVEQRGALPLVSGVAAELRAVVQALVVNAVEASPPGERVTVCLAPAGDGVQVEIEDRGPGLPASIRERLFTPHVTTKPAGSGMGLFLARRIVMTWYGGELLLEDRSRGGTRAVLTLESRSDAPAKPGEEPIVA